MSIQIGHRVIINPESECFSQYFDQHKGDKGIVIQTKDTDLTIPEGWIRVQWDNGHANNYLLQNLIVLPEECETPQPILEPPTLDIPFLPGQRVIVTEGEKTYQNMKGYIIRIKYQEDNIKKWNKKSVNEKRSTACYVKFDTLPEIRELYMYKLSPINEPSVDVIQYELKNGGTRTLLENDIYARNILDKEIINDGVQIQNVKIYNEEWRQSIVNSIK